MLLVPPTGAQLVRTWSFFVLFFILRLIIIDFLILVFPLYFSCPFERSIVAWVDDEPALLVRYCLTHPLRGWGIVDERRTETADRVARYHTEQ